MTCKYFFLTHYSDFLCIPNTCNIYISLNLRCSSRFVGVFLQSINPFFSTYILYILLISTPVLAAAPDKYLLQVPTLFI